MTNARQIPEGGCARLELTEPYFCVLLLCGRRESNKFADQIRIELQEVEKTRLIKHSMVTDTQARRIIRVSNIDQGRVVRRPVSANPGLNFNPGLFFFSSKAFSRKIFSILFRVFNH